MIEGINEENVTRWMVERIPEIKTPLNFSLIAGGHSNLTYRCVDDSGAAYVLRRPPLGQVLESAHDMGREHKIIDALKNSMVPVPKSYGLCKDKTVNSADFYVMEYIDGLVLNDSMIAGTLPQSSRGRIG